MKKEDKNLVIEALSAQLAEYAHFYLVNIEGLDAAKTSELRRECFKQDINTFEVGELAGKGDDLAAFVFFFGDAKIIHYLFDRDIFRIEDRWIIAVAHHDDFVFVFRELFF